MFTDGNGGANDDWLISPGIILTGNERLKYQYRVQSSGEPNDFELLLSTTGVAPADFTTTLIATTSYNNTTYIQETVDLSAYTGTVYVAWHVPAAGLDGWRLYIDEVNFEAIPSCLAPTGLLTSNITNASIDLTWTDVAASGSSNIEYGVTGFTQGTGTVITGTTNTTENITGLIENTTYDFYVQSDCGGGDLSTWVGPITMSTLCNAFAIPFQEGFNSLSTTEGCWTINNVNADADVSCPEIAIQLNYSCNG